jgi:DNA-binding transcriptional ArsR family regulator
MREVFERQPYNLLDLLEKKGFASLLKTLMDRGGCPITELCDLEDAKQPLMRNRIRCLRLVGLIDIRYEGKSCRYFVPSEKQTELKNALVELSVRERKRIENESGHALHHVFRSDIRRSIIEVLLQRGEMSGPALLKTIQGSTQPALSTELKNLRDRGLLQSDYHKDDQRTLYHSIVEIHRGQLERALAIRSKELGTIPATSRKIGKKRKATALAALRSQRPLPDIPPTESPRPPPQPTEQSWAATAREAVEEILRTHRKAAPRREELLACALMIGEHGFGKKDMLVALERALAEKVPPKEQRTA